MISFLLEVLYIFIMLNDIKFDPFPIIRTKQLVLRQINENDAQEILFLRSNKLVMEYLDRPLFTSTREAKNFINRITSQISETKAIVWGIVFENSNKIIGTIGYHKIIKEHHRAELGYMLHPSYQGKGLMQEALTSVIKFGFEQMKLHSIEADVNPNNEKSINLLLRNGFIKEAHFRESYHFNGVFLDSAIYSLLKS